MAIRYQISITGANLRSRAAYLESDGQLIATLQFRGNKSIPVDLERKAYTLIHSVISNFGTETAYEVKMIPDDPSRLSVSKNPEDYKTYGSIGGNKKRFRII
jgi:hypothetical protein